ncbi:MAG: hypothetical protein ACREOH_22830 [Candidatus Entotheonellia bacterium]
MPTHQDPNRWTRMALSSGQADFRFGRRSIGHLVCVRYRYDATHQRQLKTIEVIIEETRCCPECARKRAVLVGVRMGVHEVSLQREVKRAGARRNRTRQIWELRRDRRLQLGLRDGIEDNEVSISTVLPGA